MNIQVDYDELHYDSFVDRMNRYAKNTGQVAVRVQQENPPRHRKKARSALFSQEELAVIDQYDLTGDEKKIFELLEKVTAEKEAIPAIEIELSAMKNRLVKMKWIEPGKCVTIR